MVSRKSLVLENGFVGEISSSDSLSIPSVDLLSGSAAVPTLTFTGDTNTGIYSPGADQVSVATGGTERLRIDSTGQIEAVSLGTAAAPTFSFTGDPNTGIYSPGADQVAISTGGSGRLFVDASGRVLINPSATEANDRRLLIRGLGTTDGAVLLKSSSTPDGTSRGFLLQSFGASSDAYVWQQENSPLILGTNATERLRITPLGLVGIGTSSPDATLHISKALTDGDTLLRIQPTSFSAGFSVRQAFTRGSTDLVRFTVTSDAGNADKGSLLISTSSTTSTINPVAIFTGDGRVGIGTLSPSTALHVQGTTAAFGNGAASLFWGNTSTLGALTYNGTTAILQANGSSDGFAFWRGTTEHARLDSSGRLLVGTSSARTLASYGSAGLQVESTAFATASISAVNNQNTADGVALMLGKSRGAAVGSFTIVQSGDQIGGIYFQGADGAAMRNGASVVAAVDASPAYASTALVNGQTYRIVTVGTTDFTLIGASANTVGTVFTATGPGTGTGTAILNAGNMPGRLVFSTTADGASSPTERMRLTSTGQLRLAGAGITFNGDTAAANELDDYEEGTFTPTIVGTSTAGTGTYTTQIGRYTKIGNSVFFTITLAWSAHTGTGGMKVGGLPFTSDSTAGNSPPTAINSNNLTVPANSYPTSLVAQNSTEVIVYSVATGGGAIAALAIDTSATIYLAGYYTV